MWAAGVPRCALVLHIRSRQMVEREGGCAVRGGEKADGGRGRQREERCADQPLTVFQP